MIEPPVWSGEQLEAGRKVGIAEFRRVRFEEPLEDYLEAFELYLGTADELLEATVDLSDLENQALGILSQKSSFLAFRYLAGPPISLDDLKTLAEADSLRPSVLRRDPALVRRLVETVLIGLDRGRFPWVQEQREPTEAERKAAVLASAALMATSRVGTKRRSDEKKRQEGRVEEALMDAHWEKVATRTIRTLADAPARGQFCRESKFGERKADFIARLWDDRILALECKVSNSATNSVKRLNNDAAVKAEIWRTDFGARQVVSAALLSGVYKLHNLENAQARGLTIFWAHDLGEMVAWMERTRG